MTERASRLNIRTPLDVLNSWPQRLRVKPQVEVTHPKGGITYNLQCYDENGERFDLAATLADDGKAVRFKKTTFKKVDGKLPTTSLLDNFTNGQAPRVSVAIGDRTISIRRKSLGNALKAFKLIAP